MSRASGKAIAQAFREACNILAVSGSEDVSVRVIEDRAREIDRLATPPAAEGGERGIRQRAVHDWCIAAFGDDHAHSIPQRGIRLVEEAIEAGQACGCDAAMVHRLVDHIYSRPEGELWQELGGVGVTVLALAQAAGLSADAMEATELERVLSKPLGHFAARNAAKNAAGFDVTQHTETTVQDVRDPLDWLISARSCTSAAKVSPHEPMPAVVSGDAEDMLDRALESANAAGKDGQP